MEHIWISDLKDGQTVDGVYYLRNKSLATTKAGKPYLNLVLADRTGELEGKMWDSADKYDANIAAGDFVFVQARGNTYNNQLQMVVNYLEPVDKDSIDPALFLPVTSGDVNAFWQTVQTLLASIEDEPMRALCEAALADAEIADGLRRAPAATGVHQAYVGGLLEHTCSMMLLADMVCRHYPALNRDLLLTGVLFHDLGKIREMSYELSLDYTDEGRLVGHQVIAVEYVTRLAAGVGNIPAETVTLLHHLILSHHGRPEFGATKLPMFAEAAVLHYLDNLDAKVFGFLEAEAQSTGNWSDRKWFLETQVYKIKRAETGYRFTLPGQETPPAKGKKTKTKQDLPLFEK